MEESCATCGKTGDQAPNLKRCAKCKTSFYCSRDCQKADWKVHKKACSAQGASRATEAASGSTAPLTWPPGVTLPTGTFLTPPVETTKRTDFTNFFLGVPCPENAHPTYENIFHAHQLLVRMLIEHPAMKPNLEQTFNTPANSKNKVYFMWDFLLRTFQLLVAKIHPRHPEICPMYDDILSRILMAKELMLDKTGRLDEMNASVGNRKYDRGVEFGEEILKVAEKLDDESFDDELKQMVQKQLDLQMATLKAMEE